MDCIQIILDKRIPLKVLQVLEGENVIFCKSFKEELFDSGFFSTKEKDFVHKYIIENNQKYIITDVITPDKKIYKNIKFKVVMNENSQIPDCTFNPNGIKSEKTEYKLPETKAQIIVEKKIEEPIKEPLKKLPDLKIEEKNITNKEHLKKINSGPAIPVILDGRIPFELVTADEGENVIFCKSFKEELLDSGLFSTKVKDFVHKYVIENNQKYIITDVNTPDDKTYKNVKFRIQIVEEEGIPHSLFNPKNINVINEKVFLPENKITENLKFLEETKHNELEKKKLEEVQKNLDEKRKKIINEQKEILNKKNLLKEQEIKALQEKQKIEKEIQQKQKTLKETKDEIIASSKQYLEEKLKVYSEENKSYARRILELGGGGSVAVQYANGGVMQGNLNVTGNYLSAGVDLLNIFTGGGGGGGGDPAVNALVYSNSANWNTAYTNLIYNSASYLSGTAVNLGNIPVLSGYWTEAYTNLVNNSASYLTGTAINLGQIPALSSYWTEAYTNLVYNSTAYLSAYDISLINSNSASWNTAYTNLVYNSTAYLSAYDMSLINANSAKYDSVYTQTTNLSTYWAGNSLLINSDTYVDSSVSNYLINSSSNLIVCYLPTNPQYGTTFTFQDMFNKWNTYNLTISSNDSMIMGKPLFEPLICDVPGITFTIVYVGGIWGWKVQ